MQQCTRKKVKEAKNYTQAFSYRSKVCSYQEKDFSLEVNTAILKAFRISEPLAVFIALILVGLSKLLKQRIYVKLILNEAKNPNWLKANQLTIFQLGLRI